MGTIVASYRKPHFRSARSDQYGRFSLTGLAPGIYRILAMEKVDSGEESNPQFRNTHRNNFVTVDLGEGAQKNVELKLTKGA